MVAISVALLLQESLWLSSVLPWLAPLAVSVVTGAGAGYGSFRFAHGALVQRVITTERDVAEIRGERSEFVTRNEFDLLRDDLREIKMDVREVRRSLTQ